MGAVTIAIRVAPLVLGALYVDARHALGAERGRAKIREDDVERLKHEHAREVAELRAALAAKREPFAQAEPKLRLVEQQLGPGGKATVRRRLAALKPEDAA